jgi:ubiquinone/menaquinone biosynthesis C-methylase UbiE
LEWWESFFDARYLQAYRWVEDKTEQEVDFVVDVVGVQPSDRILDLCCGQGRHTLELARRGFSVSGLDQSEYLLSVAKERTTQAQLPVEFIQGDMRRLPFKEESDVVLNLFTAFAYFDDDQDDVKALWEIARVLKQGGRFLLDMINREWIVRNFQRRGWQDFGDSGLLLETRELDLETGRLRADVTFIENGEATRRTTCIRLYTLHELKGMMREVGLELVAKYGGFDGRDYTLDSNRMILLAQKKKPTD